MQPTAPPATPAPHAALPRAETTYRPRERMSLPTTVGFFRRGRNDPTQTAAGGVIWRATRTPEGVALTALRQSLNGDVNVAAWGPGRFAALDQVPALCGADDCDEGFNPALHTLVRDAHHRVVGLRLGRTDCLFDALTQSVIEQKVTAGQAFGAWSRLVEWFGEPVPGPSPRPMFAPPTAEGWRHIPSWAWHRAGLEPPQSKAIVRAARVAPSLERCELLRQTATRRDEVLTSIRGIGPWTAAETRIRALGDPDAVSVGDYHLSHQIGYALTGSRTDDAGMLELLAPWPGHRQRVIRLLALSGVREPRRAPRLHPQDHRRH